MSKKIKLLDILDGLEKKNENKTNDCNNIMRWCRTRHGLQNVPSELPRETRYKFLFEMYGVTEEDVRVFDNLSIKDDVLGIQGPRVFCPPTGVCFNCETNLHVRTATDIQVLDLTGITPGRKVTLRCSKCLVTYQYSRYGKSETGFRFYEEGRDHVEASDVVFATKRLCELQCALANHAWVSFDGFATAVTESILRNNNVKSIDRRTVSNMFYWYEVEKELRRINQINFRFSNHGTSFEDAFNIIENNRQLSVYPHTCSPSCVKKGCGRMVVFDGIWKLTFTHCMMVSKNAVKGVPMLNLPEVCTSEPQAGHAFCRKHVELMQRFNEDKEEGSEVPTKLRDFLKFCGVDMKPSEDAPLDDISVVNEKVLRTVSECGLDCEQGDNVIGGHAGQNVITSDINAVKSVLEGSHDSCPSEPICNKDTGEKKPMHQRSRGHMAAVSPGGHIYMFNPLYRMLVRLLVLLVVDVYITINRQINSATRILFILGLYLAGTYCLIEFAVSRQ